jgi:hypothetical protein
MPPTVRPLTGVLTRTTFVPLPTVTGPVVCPKLPRIPHSNQAVESKPLGVAIPLRVALEALIGPAGRVAENGAMAQTLSASKTAPKKTISLAAKGNGFGVVTRHP